MFENLVAVARATTEQPTLKETLQNTLDVAAILTDAESGSLILLDENGIVTHQIQALERRTSAQDPAFLQQVMTPGLGDWVVSQRQATIIADVALDQRWLPLTDKDQTPTRSVLAVLIVTGTILLGVLTLTHSAPGHFKADQLHLMQAAADQMALAIRNAQIFEAQRRLADRQITLNEILRTVAAQTQPEQVIRVAVKMINQFAGWSNVIIALPNKEETYWTAHSVTGTLTGLASLIFPMKPGLIGDAFKKVQTQLKWGASIDPRIDGQAPANCWALAVPMRRGAQILGVLGLEGPPSTTFDNDDVLLAESLAEAVALALENARLLTETQQRLREQTALRSASMMISSTLDLPTVLNRMAEQMGQAVDVSSAVICDYEPEAMTATVLAEYCGPQASSPERVSDLGNTCDLSQDFQSLVSLFRSGQPGLTHLDNPYLTKAQKARMQQLGVQTMLTIPLQIRGQTVAYAELQESRRHRDFTAEEIALCQGMAQQTAIAMENARLYNEIRQHAAGLSALYGVTRIVNQSLVLEEVLPQALTSALMSLGFEAGVISLFDPATDRLYIAAESGLPSILSAYLQNNEVKGSLGHYVYTHQETLTISDLSQQAPVDVSELLALGFCTYTGIPLLHRKQALGAMSLFARQPRAFSTDDLGLLSSVGHQIAAAVANAQLFQSIADERSRLQALIEASRDGIILIGMDQRLLVTNAPALNQLGLSGPAETWTGRPITEILAALRSQAPNVVRAAVSEMRRIRHGDEPPAEGEYELSDHVTYWFNLPVLAGTTPVGRLIVLRDITASVRSHPRCPQPKPTAN